MTEGPTQGPTARRGRRQPAITAAMEQETMLDDVADQPMGEQPMVFPGDIIAVKVTAQIEAGGQDSWFTYGLQSHIQPDESEEEAFLRAASVVNTRVIDLAYDAEERITQARQDFNSRRINPQPRR